MTVNLILKYTKCIPKREMVCSDFNNDKTKLDLLNYKTMRFLCCYLWLEVIRNRHTNQVA